jgi:hypothetical protein
MSRKVRLTYAEISPEGRERIAAAQRRRWANAKKAASRV